MTIIKNVVLSAADVLAKNREAAEITFADLAETLVNANILTGAEVKTWAKSGTLPAPVVTAIDALPTVRELAQAYVEGRTDSSFARNSVFIDALRVAYNRTPEQVDALFGIA